MACHRTPVRRCPQCGCTDAQACQGGCSWVDGSDLCSACFVPTYSDADLDQIIAEQGVTWDAGVMAKAWKAERIGIAAQLRVPCTVEEITEAIAELQEGGGTPTEFMRAFWLAIRSMNSGDGVTITKRLLQETDWTRASLKIEPDQAMGSTVIRAMYRV